MGEISGVSTTDIDNVDGFFTTQSGGGTATTSPTITVSTVFSVVTVTVTNHSTYTNPNYSAIAKVGNTTTVADTDVEHTLETDKTHLSDTFVFNDTDSTAGQRTLEVRAQDFGDKIQSAATTANYTIAGLPSARYIRIRGVESDGSDSDKRIWIYEMRFYESANQSGTSHPTMMANATTDDDGNNYYTISAGHNYSNYNPYEAFDDSSSNYDAWWSLSTSAANNWIQMKFDDTQFPTPPSIASFEIGSLASGTYVDYIAIETSNDGTNFTQQAVFAFNDSTTNMQNFP